MPRLLKHRNLIVILFLLVSFAGFADATFLAVEHYQGKVPPCSMVRGCEKVTTSTYSTIAGVPIALPGALYYLTLFGVALFFLDTRKIWAMQLAAFLTFVGFGISLVLVSIQLFILHAICLYCMFSALTSTILFILGLLFLTSQSSLETSIEANSDILLED